MRPMTKIKGDLKVDLRGDLSLGQQMQRRVTRNTSSLSQANGRDTPSHDPHMGLRFWVQLGQIEIAGFRECSSLMIETEVMEFIEGGENTYTHQLPVRTKYKNITLKRGMDDTRALYDWYTQNVTGPVVRQNISIVIYDSQQNIKRQWDLKNAWPCKWTGPELKAETGSLAVETLEIAHEGLLPSSS